MSAALAEVLAQQLGLPTSSWSMGEFGALAEFHHVGTSSLRGLALDAAEGSVAIDGIHCTAIAYETISGRPGRWLHGLALCLPVREARMNQRRVITELGPDDGAIRPVERAGLLFDLGLGLTTVDFCVRSGDESLLQALRAAQGTSLLANRPLFERLQQASPHRVLVSRLARLEVRAAIPRAGEHSPPGPHTHLLPHLLNRRLVCSANIPIPPQLLPCIYLYPAHPMEDDAFDTERHDAFQQLMRGFGAADQLDAKQELQDAILRGDAPRGLRGARSRHGRLAMRATLRQLQAQGFPPSRLGPWEAACRAAG
ncbi:MAG: hypothetical protein JWQ07_3029 [Ramlibacter sp.]|nr:hypothetical protein [Ramlibacter sp.]